MDFQVTPPKALRGTVRVPGDKSISHRAVMIGALAQGDTYIENFLSGADCIATIRCFRSLGVKFKGPTANGRLIVHGRGPQALQEPANILNAANSGTTTRLILGILAGLPFFSVITGDASLRRRPMSRVAKPLRQMGAQIWGRQEGSIAPLAIRGGNINGIQYTLPVASAQVKSALLLAGLLAEGETAVTEPVSSRDHTERMLELFGAKLEKTGDIIRINGKQTLYGQHVEIPGDISSAAFLLVAGAIVPGSDIIISGVGINPTRTGILDVLKQMGADITIFNRRLNGGEPVADIQVRASSLKGLTIDGDLIPRLIDEIPIIAVAGAVAEGRTEIRDAAELKVKESNRLAVVVEELRKFKVEIEELSDGLKINGGHTLQAALCNSHKDHRIAMAMTIAGFLASGETVIKDIDCVAVSFPDFFSILNSLRVE